MRKFLRRVVPGILAALLLACAPKEDRSGLARKPVSRPAASGWARLPLDAEAQRAYPDLWLGDAEGVPVPFEASASGMFASLPFAARLTMPPAAAPEANTRFTAFAGVPTWKPCAPLAAPRVTVPAASARSTSVPAATAASALAAGA